MKTNGSIKTIAVLIVGIFTMTTVAHSAPPVYSIKVDEKYGRISQRYKGEKNRTIIHIQDAHSNLSAQRNLAKIICDLIPQLTIETRPETQENRPAESTEVLESIVSGLQSNVDVPFVGIEGALGEYSLSELQRFPLRDIREHVATQYVREGKLIGAEMASILSEEEFTLYGLEDPALLVKDFQAFLAVQRKMQELEQEIQALEEAIGLLKEHYWNDLLYTFDQEASAYEKNANIFTDYIHTLLHAIDETELEGYEYVQLSQFKELLMIEAATNKNAFDAEVSCILTQFDNEDAMSLDLKDHIASYRNGDISERACIAYIMACIEKKGLNHSQYKQITSKQRYWRKYYTIDMSALLEEVITAGDAVRMQLAHNEKEKNIIELLRQLRLLKSLLALKATREEVAFFRQEKEKYSLSRLWHIAREIDTAHHLKKQHTIDTTLENMFRFVDTFYEYADERDHALVDNLLSVMNERAQDIGVVVAGGYHSDGLTHLLKERDYSFVTITPHIENLGEEVLYRERMVGSIAPLNPMLGSALQISQINLAGKLAFEDTHFKAILQEAGYRMNGSVFIDPDGNPLDQERITILISSIKEKAPELAEAMQHIFEEGLLDEIIAAQSQGRDVHLGKDIANQRLLNKFLEQMKKILQTTLENTLDGSNTYAEESPLFRRPNLNVFRNRIKPLRDALGNPIHFPRTDTGVNSYLDYMRNVSQESINADPAMRPIEDVAPPRFLGTNNFQRTILIRDKANNRFIVTIVGCVFDRGTFYGGRVAEVAVELRKEKGADAEFIVLNDREIRNAFNNALSNHPLAGINVRNSEYEAKFDSRTVKVMAGFLSEDEVEYFRQHANENPILGHMVRLVEEHYPELIMRGLVRIEKPQDKGGHYMPAIGLEPPHIVTFCEMPAQADLYAHELFHHVYAQLKEAFRRYQQSGNEDYREMAEKFLEIQLYCDRNPQMLVHTMLEASPLYGARVMGEAGKIYRNNETLAYILGALTEGLAYEPYSQYRITFGDVALLVELGVLPRELYAHPELIKGMKATDPLPPQFHTIANLLQEMGSLERVLDNEEMLNEIKYFIKKRGNGSFLAIAEWLLARGDYGLAYKLIQHLRGDSSFDFPGKNEELLITEFALRHLQTDVNENIRYNAYQLLTQALHLVSDKEAWIRIFSHQAMDTAFIKSLRDGFNKSTAGESLLEVLNPLIEELIKEIAANEIEMDKRQTDEKTDVGTMKTLVRRQIVLCHAINNVLTLAGSEGIREVFAEKEKAAWQILQRLNEKPAYMMFQEFTRTEGDPVEGALFGQDQRAGFTNIFVFKPETLNNLKALDWNDLNIKNDLFKKDYKDAFIPEIKIQDLSELIKKTQLSFDDIFSKKDFIFDGVIDSETLEVQFDSEAFKAGVINIEGLSLLVHITRVKSLRHQLWSLMRQLLRYTIFSAANIMSLGVFKYFYKKASRSWPVNPFRFNFLPLNFVMLASSMALLEVYNLGMRAVYMVRKVLTKGSWFPERRVYTRYVAWLAETIMSLAAGVGAHQLLLIVSPAGIAAGIASVVAMIVFFTPHIRQVRAGGFRVSLAALTVMTGAAVYAALVYPGGVLAIIALALAHFVNNLIATVESEDPSLPAFAAGINRREFNMLAMRSLGAMALWSVGIFGCGAQNTNAKNALDGVQNENAIDGMSLDVWLELRLESVSYNHFLNWVSGAGVISDLGNNYEVNYALYQQYAGDTALRSSIMQALKTMFTIDSKRAQETLEHVHFIAIVDAHPSAQAMAINGEVLVLNVHHLRQMQENPERFMYDIILHLGHEGQHIRDYAEGLYVGEGGQVEKAQEEFRGYSATVFWMRKINEYRPGTYSKEDIAAQEFVTRHIPDNDFDGLFGRFVTLDISETQQQAAFMVMQAYFFGDSIFEENDTFIDADTRFAYYTKETGVLEGALVRFVRDRLQQAVFLAAKEDKRWPIVLDENAVVFDKDTRAVVDPVTGEETGAYMEFESQPADLSSIIMLLLGSMNGASLLGMEHVVIGIGQNAATMYQTAANTKQGAETESLLPSRDEVSDFDAVVEKNIDWSFNREQAEKATLIREEKKKSYALLVPKKSEYLKSYHRRMITKQAEKQGIRQVITEDDLAGLDANVIVLAVGAERGEFSQHAEERSAARIYLKTDIDFDAAMAVYSTYFGLVINALIVAAEEMGEGEVRISDIFALDAAFITNNEELLAKINAALRLAEFKVAA